ncbi:ARM repeat-containing protein [Annulohypoxylon maeteangense]|uniref:ARM repeat-containing protein n=1 Tax=Annulohypoxylon maeteangense TaxID=1927788 RepID=UPI002007808A|nr:ARM repeat-containing protein [Annulohypoxylon maeteangense]KAI0882772.1 ARM repeat-containing protein [Annulohypoxylon maeteangense]
MAELLTEEQVDGLLAFLRKDASIEAKVQHVTAVKSDIKHYSVPDTCVAPLFEALRLASSSQHSVLVNAGFTTLNHLLTRMSLQEPKFIVKEAKHTLPLIVEKMGDQKDKIRALAIQAMATIYIQVPMDAERFVRNTAMAGKNPRAKEAGMQWLLQMNKEHGLQFRTYVPTLMELLEDADGMVRDAAKSTVIELFKDAPNAAKSDLKKQLKNFKVRPAIEQAIVKALAPTSARADPESRPGSSMMQGRPNLAASVSSLVSDRPITPMPETKAESVEPSYVNTQRELDDTIKDMHQWFESKETEQNWLKREESITKLRRLNAGNAPSDFPDVFVNGCRALLDGIIKAVVSLRTSLSKEGCALVQDLANTFGPGIDPMVELLMQTFIKLCAATKKITSQLANAVVDTIVGRVTYNARIMQHVWGACQDKNVQPRMYATGWLKTLLKKESHHKNHLEHGGGLDMIEKCIKKGLNDANPGVREKMRSTYWAFAAIWPARAEVIIDNLEATAQKLLQKDPNNPNSPKKSEPASRPGLGLSKSTMTSTKPSLREAMLAQKRALNTRNLPSRPGSAMATVTPARTVSGSSNVSSASHATAPATRTRPERPESAMKSHGGMSVAPMRPARRRPDIAPRPATAGPYSVRSHDGPSREHTSPTDTAKSKGVTPKTISGSPRRTAPRTRPGHAATASESSIAPTPSKPANGKATKSPRTSPTRGPVKSPGKVKPPFASEPNLSSPSNPNEDITLVVPTIAQLKESARPAAPKSSPSPRASIIIEDVDASIVSKSASATPTPTPSKALKVYEDPFTEDQTTPRPSVNPIAEQPVLKDKPINEDAANLSHPPTETNGTNGSPLVSPDKSRQNSRLIESGIARVKAQTLDVHGFRKLQSLLRDNKIVLEDSKFDALLQGLFEYLESPLGNIAPEKIQDVKAQILATIKLLLKKSRDRFQPHVSRGLQALLAARTRYDARTHIVSGLELLADELVVLGDAAEITVTMTKNLTKMDMDTSGHRSLSMGLHVLKELVDTRTTFSPSENEIAGLLGLATRCLESKESGVRMDAVQLCVALHARLGEAKFWESMKNIKDDPKSLITYYIVKRQRENGVSVA